MSERLFMENALGLERQQKLKAISIERLSLPEMQGVATSFGQHLRSGLEGKPSSLATIPTHLKPVDPTTISQTSQALVVEIGGTNIYGGLIGVDNGQANLAAHVQVAYDAKRKKKYPSAQDFFTEVATAVSPLLHNDVSSVGIIWSFPADVFSAQNGIDAISTDRLPKEFVIPGINNQPLGDYLIDALRKYSSALSPATPRAVVNDTAAVLLANGGMLGGIVGTGFNFAFAHGTQIYNLESGGFTDVPQTQLAKEIDTESERQGHYLAEKQISGDYVGKMFTKSAQKLGLPANEQFHAEDMSTLLTGDARVVLEKMPTASEETQAVLLEQAKVLRDRSAQLVASMIVGAIQEFPEDFTGEEIRIPIEGSFFGKTPGYKEAVATYTAQLLPDKHVVYIPVSQSGIKGAGVAALSLLS